MIRTAAAVVVADAWFCGQTTRTETVKSTNPADDARGLTPGMADSVAVSTNIERVVVIRFRNQADLLAGIESVGELKVKIAPAL